MVSGFLYNIMGWLMTVYMSLISSGYKLGPENLLPNESGPARIFNTPVFVVYHNYSLGPMEVMFHSIIIFIL